MKIWLRWFFVVPSAVLSWYAFSWLGARAIAFLVGYCSPDNKASEICSPSGFPLALQALSCLVASLAVCSVVALAAIVAPAHRLLVAKISFLIVGALVTYMAIPLSAYWELGVSLIVGLAMLFFIGKHWAPGANA